jgi:hypothetical protein
MHRRWISAGFLFMVIVAVSASAFDTDVVHAVAGAVTKVDAAAKTIAIKTADGTEEVFKFTAKTTVTASKMVAGGVKKAGVESYMAGKEGTHVVVRYVTKGSDKTAVAVKDFGKDALKAGKGTVTKVDQAGHTVAIKAEDGTEETFHISKDAAVDTEHGVVEGAKFSAKEGDKVIFHYGEEAGDKVVHFVKKI